MAFARKNGREERIWSIRSVRVSIWVSLSDNILAAFVTGGQVCQYD